ncbi:MAG: class I mannose-6-phosphate isomerase [Clostridia bacterium]|nr:class I mannose-6-phosphate isomerase [Clostridia bacterium]
MEIIKTLPVYKDYIWGGTKLKSLWNKNSEKDIIAESWELSLHKDGVCRADGGKYSGRFLDQIITPEMIGENNSLSRFPILIKLIDARQNLSVQVHPDDAYALKNENDYGKTEMWYIADAEEGGGIYLGFKENITKQIFINALKENAVEKLLNFVPVKKGDSFLISAGQIHAICKGVTICEIQQNSNVTYRVYDYNRTDASGNKRELHTQKALEVLNFNKYKAPKNYGGNILAKCKYFTVKKYSVSGSINFYCGSASFNSVLVLEGSGEIKGRSFNKGDTFFIPAGLGQYNICGNAEILLVSI